MKHRIIAYRRYIDQLLQDDAEVTDWESVRREHLVQISFFQHERLVHLLVTLTFAVLTLLSLAIVFIGDYLPMVAAVILFMVLLVPYVFHYYLLENEVQKMYEQYDEILNRKNKKG